MPKSPSFLTAEQAGAVLGITGRQVRYMIARGVLQAEQLGNAYLIRREDLERVPRERKRGPKGNRDLLKPPARRKRGGK